MGSQAAFDERPLCSGCGSARLDALTAGWPLLGQGDALVLALRHAPMGDDVASIELDFQFVLVSRTSTRRPIQSTGTD